MTESREGCVGKEDGDGPEAEKAREPTVESLVRKTWRLRLFQKQSGEYGRVCKAESTAGSDSHRDKTEQCP